MSFGDDGGDGEGFCCFNFVEYRKIKSGDSIDGVRALSILNKGTFLGADAAKIVVFS